MQIKTIDLNVKPNKIVKTSYLLNLTWEGCGGLKYTYILLVKMQNV